MTPKAPVALSAIRLVHTIVWAFFVAVILGIPVAVWQRQIQLFWVLTGIVIVEVLVLALNNLRCPLTGVAARYTEDRRDNFDIYLPLLLARYNKQVFGTVFVAGVVFGVIRVVTGR